jgi:hypothetical protein
MSHELFDGREPDPELRLIFTTIVRASTLASIEIVRESGADAEEQARAIAELLDFERECLEAERGCFEPLRLG